MQDHWQAELSRLAFALLLGLALGQLTGYSVEALFISLLAYTLHNLYHLRRFMRWLTRPDQDTPAHFGIWADIEVQIKRMEKVKQQRLHELDKHLSQLYESITALPDAVVALGKQGEIQWFNQTAQHYLALHDPEDIGQPLINLFRHPAIVRYMQTGDFSQVIQVTAPGLSDHTLCISMNPYGNGQHLFIAQDITERLRIDQVRKDFVANVSHELRTPLTVVSGFLENMLAETSDCPRHWDKPLTLMEQQANRMRHLVEDLLLLARLEGGVDKARRELVDITGMAQTLVNEARALAGDKLEVILNIASTQQLMGNPAQLRSAFINLITNAVHYTPPSGHVCVTWRTDAAGGYFIVEDDGEGIDKAHLPRLTERFYRVDVGRSRSQGGTGLGLAIVKHVLQAHGAVLDVHSVVGQGSRFCCIFPVSRLRQQENSTAA